MLTRKDWDMKRITYSRLWLFLALAALSLVSLAVGVKEFKLLWLFQPGSEGQNLAVLSRIPRLLSILITGASLSIAGLIMQTLTRNKFVAPSTAGTMEWCRFGVMLALLVFAGAGTGTKMTVAFICSLGGTLLFMRILSVIPYRDSVMVPLIGMMLGSVVSSVTTFFADRYDMVQNISSWLEGSFSLIIKGRYEMLYLGIPFLILGYVYADRFTISGMGEDMAKGLGLNHKAVVFAGLAIVALITSTVIVTVGSIPFVGMIIPNMVSIWKGDNLKNSIGDTALLGALFVLVCDLAGRLLIFPYEVSVSVMMSVVGSVVFLTILFRKNSPGVRRKRS